MNEQNKISEKKVTDLVSADEKMSLNERKIIYRARRGLKELDFYIDPYVKQHFSNATDAEKKIFAALVEKEDPDLLNWFMDVEQPEDAELAALIKKIRNLKIF